MIHDTKKSKIDSQYDSRFDNYGEDDEDSSHERRPKFVDHKPIKGMDVDLCYIYI